MSHELVQAIETPKEDRTPHQQMLVDDYTREKRLNERDQRVVPRHSSESAAFTARDARIDYEQHERPEPQKPATAKPIPTLAGSTLRRVADIVDGARNETHGEKVASFQAIAKRWSKYAYAELSGTDYALMMAEMKMERIRHGGVRMEHLEDVIGYLGCAVQLAVAEGLIRLDDER